MLGAYAQYPQLMFSDAYEAYANLVGRGKAEKKLLKMLPVFHDPEFIKNHGRESLSAEAVKDGIDHTRLVFTAHLDEWDLVMHDSLMNPSRATYVRGLHPTDNVLQTKVFGSGSLKDKRTQ